MGTALRQVWAGLVDLVLPETCAGCGADGGMLCVPCREPLRAAARLRRPDPCPSGLPAPWSVATYDGVVRAALLAHKERGRTALVGPLADALARAVAAATGPDPPVHTVLLVPAPSRRSAVRERGHDATLRLARSAASALRRSGSPVAVAPVLRVRSRVTDQAGLDASGRSANLAGGLWVPARLTRLVARRRVVLVDDVITTGATLTEATRALTAAGARVEAAATVAATPRRTTPPGRPPGVEQDATWD